MDEYLDRLTQKEIDKYIRSISIEKDGDKFYGTLTDKEGRTFEFSKPILDMARLFNKFHKEKIDDDIKDLMITNVFQRFFVGAYLSRRAFGKIETGSPI